MLKLGPVFLLIIVAWFIGCSSGTKISSLEPNRGNVAGNDDVVIYGSGFKPGMVVRFGKNEVKSVVIDSPTVVRVKTPAGVEGKADVAIIHEDGTSVVLTSGFTYMHDA